MRQTDVNPAEDPTIMGNDRPRQDGGAPDGQESAGTHQEPKPSQPAVQGDGRIKGQRGQRGQRPEDRDQATHGPEDRHGEERQTM